MFHVLKFGGTSVGTAARMKELVHLTVDQLPKIVVLSAMSGTTNSLVEICASFYNKDLQSAKTQIEALKERYENEIKALYSKEESLVKGQQLIDNHFSYITAFTLDMFTANEEKAILAQGELLSTAMYHYYLEEIGVESVLLPALNFMRLDANDEPDQVYIEKYLQAELAKYPGKSLFITQGFICRNIFGEIDNLKRGGSDYSASLIGAALRSTEIQIWTDIDGMHNNDPRIVENTQPIHELSFEEAAELAYFGAKILHPTCILPAQKRNIPVRLKNTMQPTAPGTLIANIDTQEGIKAIAAKDGITAITIKSDRMLLAHGFLRAVFEIFERYKTPIDMICTSEVAVSLTVDSDTFLSDIVRELKDIASVDMDPHQTIICIVGRLPKDKAGYAHQVLEALKDVPLRMVSYGGSPHNISVLVNGDLKKTALLALHNRLFTSH